MSRGPSSSRWHQRNSGRHRSDNRRRPTLSTLARQRLGERSSWAVPVRMVAPITLQQHSQQWQSTPPFSFLYPSALEKTGPLSLVRNGYGFLHGNHFQGADWLRLNSAYLPNSKQFYVGRSQRCALLRQPQSYTAITSWLPFIRSMAWISSSGRISSGLTSGLDWMANQAGTMRRHDPRRWNLLGHLDAAR